MPRLLTPLLALLLSLGAVPQAATAQGSPSAAPSSATATGTSCAAADREQPPLFGTVRDIYGRALANAVVEVSWQEQVIGPQERSQRAASASDTSDASGAFRICEAPAPRAIAADQGGRTRVVSALRLSASRGALRSRVIEIAEAGATAAPLEIRLAPDSLRTVAAGTVLDTLGRPLPGARIRVEGDSLPGAVTDEEGFFQIANVPAATHQYSVRAIGYTPLIVTAASEEGMDIHLGTLQMGPTPPLLDTVRVLATQATRLQREFAERRSVLTGVFLDEAEIARLPRLTAGFIASRGSRMQVISLGPSRAQQRFVLRGGFGGQSVCVPRVFLDGQDLGNDIGMDELETYLAQAKRIEVYRAAFAPPRFTDFNGCGALVIWTR